MKDLKCHRNVFPALLVAIFSQVLLTVNGFLSVLTMNNGDLCMVVCVVGWGVSKAFDLLQPEEMKPSPLDFKMHLWQAYSYILRPNDFLCLVFFHYADPSCSSQWGVFVNYCTEWEKSPFGAFGSIIGQEHGRSLQWLGRLPCWALLIKHCDGCTLWALSPISCCLGRRPCLFSRQVSCVLRFVSVQA